MTFVLSPRMTALLDATSLQILFREEEVELSGEDAVVVADALRQLAHGATTADGIDAEVRAVLGELGALVDPGPETMTATVEPAFEQCIRIRSIYDDEGFRAAFARADGSAVIVEDHGAIVVPLAHVCAFCVRERLLARRRALVFERARAVAQGAMDLVAWPSLRGRPTARDAIAATLASRPQVATVLDDDGHRSEHIVLPHPCCPRCRPPFITTFDGAQYALGRIFQPSPVCEPAPLFDPVFGPLTRSVVPTRGEGFRALPIVQGGIAYVSGSNHRSSTQTAAMGSGPDLQRREAVLLSELVERYGLRARTHDVGQRSALELGALAVAPSAFAGFLEHDRRRFALPFLRADETAVVDWVWALDLVQRTPRLLPLDHVVLERGGDPQHRLVDLHVSTGAAAHPSPTRALFSALREIIERDAAMITWYKQVRLPVLDLPPLLPDPVADELRTHLRRRGLRMTFFDLRLDISLPGVFVVATRDVTEGAFEAGAVVVATAMGENIGVALAHALQELAFHDETLSLFPDPSKDWRSVRYDPEDPGAGHGSWWPLYTHYLNPAHAPAFRFLLESTSRIALDEIPVLPGKGDDELLASLLHRVTQVHELPPYAVDLSTPDMSPSGRTSVKVVIPGFVDAASGRQTMRLATPRLARAVRGRDALPDGKLNNDPHPAM
jgi:thiazole/oxazole-forming peptide maturase SagD family component